MIDYSEVLKAKALRPRAAVEVPVSSIAEALGERSKMNLKMRQIRFRHGYKEKKAPQGKATSGGVNGDVF